MNEWIWITYSPENELYLKVASPSLGLLLLLVTCFKGEQKVFLQTLRQYNIGNVMKFYMPSKWDK